MMNKCAFSHLLYIQSRHDNTKKTKLMIKIRGKKCVGTCKDCEHGVQVNREDAYKESGLVRNMMELDRDQQTLTLENLSCQTIREVFMEKNVENIQDDRLFELIMACDFMQCPQRMDVFGKELTRRMERWDTTKIRNLFHIDPDLSPEEEEAIIIENKWIMYE
jgi:Skp1 family, dimerisation domain